MTYLIHESNIERLEKQLKTIQNKCNKLGTEFHYSKGAEVFKEVTDPDTLQTYIARFIEVEADGVARINGWEFVAVIEHMDGHGKNIVRQFNMNYTVPDRYYTVVPTCEHCNTKRTRKQTYLLVNESGEWKQVGGSCLKEFTGGLDAAQLAAYISCFDRLVEYDYIEPSGECATRYYNTKVMLQCASEMIRAFGYVGTDHPDATYLKALELYNYVEGYTKFSYSDEVRIAYMMDDHNIDVDSVDVDPIIDWVLNRADCSFGYMMNLRAVVNTEYVKRKHLGLLCSAVQAHNREMEKLAADRAREAEMAEEAQHSSYVADKGQKFNVSITSCKCLTSWDTQFGTTYVYKFVDTLGRVIIWKTSNTFCIDRVIQLSGKVKDHDTYQGVKQTVAYFCKVVERPVDDRPSEDDLAANRKAMADIDEALDMLDEYDRDAYSPSSPWNAPGMKVSDFIR